MYPILRKSHRYTLSFCCHLVQHCLSLKSLVVSKFIHAKLIKLGFNTHTFLGNRCADVYSRFGNGKDAMQAFDDIVDKNVISWNICLNVFVKSGELQSAGRVFDEMAQRDVVSWNSMISGYASNGFVESAFEIFLEMQNSGVRPSGYTFSILMSCAPCALCGKQIHGGMIRRGWSFSNVIIGNSLIGMYGKLGIPEYAFVVFLAMEEWDVISWNSLILGFHKSGCDKLALKQFSLMRAAGYSPDGFTISSVITICSDLHDLDKGMQILSLSIKVGLLSNTIVSSAAIDLFSKCNRMEDSINIFEEIDVLDSAICNSMMSIYSRHGFEENAMQLFVFTMKENLRPTEFTISCVLNAASIFYPMEQGSQLHALVVKLGFESDSIVDSSLVEMYSKCGSVGAAMNVFAEMDARDLISWNTMIMGLTYNGKLVESLDLFKEMLQRGPPPDQITLSGVLLACKYGGFLNEALAIFSSMETEYGVIPRADDYAYIVEMMSQAGKIEEALAMLEAMSCEPKSYVWGSVLHACRVNKDLKLIEIVAEKMIELEPRSYLPYMVLAEAYERRGRWDSLVRVSKAMKDRCRKEVVGCSWIGIKNQVLAFKADHIFQHGGQDIYSITTLLIKQIEDEQHAYNQNSELFIDSEVL